MKNKKIVLCCLFILTVLLYGQIIQAPFIYDDHELLLASPLIKSLDAPFLNWQTAGTKLISYWTFAVNYQLGGENSVGYHLVNMILHTLNAWFLYLLILLFFKTPHFENSRSSPEISGSVAAVIFLCHPLQTQAVSYIWQRTELLSAFFYFSTLIFYLRGRLVFAAISKISYGNFMLAAMSFFLGFYSKGMIVSFPLLALLIEDALFDSPRPKRTLLYTCGIVAIFVELFFWQIPFLNELRYSLRQDFIAFTGTWLSQEHFYTQIDVFTRYIFLTVFPFWQNLDHSVPMAVSFWDQRVIFSMVFLLFVLAGAIQFWKRHRLVAFGIFWFFIALIPSALLGGRDPMVEHRLYFPIGGFALLTAALFINGFERKKEYGWFVLLFVGMLSILTISRNHLWQSPELLFEDTARKSPDLSRPALMLGTVYLTQNRWPEASEMFVKAITLDPRCAEAYNNLGFILLNNGRSMEAEKMFEKAIAVREKFAPAYINLGYFALQIGDDDRAEELFRKAITLGKVDSGLRGLKNVELTRRRFKDLR